METVTQAPRQGLSIAEAAARLGISRSGVYRLISRGELRPVKIGHRTIIPSSETDRLLGENADQDAASTS